MKWYSNMQTAVLHVRKKWETVSSLYLPEKSLKGDLKSGMRDQHFVCDKNCCFHYK